MSSARWMPEHGGYWAVSNYPQVTRVLADAASFSAQDAEIPRPEAFHARPIPFQLERPHHRPIRRIVDAVLAETVTSQLEAPLRAAARRQLVGFRAGDEFELADDFAVPVVAAGLWRLLGMRWPDEARFTDRSRAMTRALWAEDGNAPVTAGEAFGSADTLEELVLAVIDRGLEDAHGLLAALRRMTWQSYYADQTMEMHILAVGLVATALANTVTTAVVAVEHLGEHPADRQAVLDRPDGAAAAVEELLRLYPPQSPARIVMRDTHLGGARLRVGDAVLGSVPAANRDPEVFRDPGRLVLYRASRRHLSFGAGRHYCPGASLARMLLRVMLEELHAAVPHYRVRAAPAAVDPSPMRAPARRLWIEPMLDGAGTAIGGSRPA
ncbi:MAG TPA: cytochrome P450 [Streptosporangiaceae bacterium]|nr:cytochrome P450 [Streptosporangiaceae bacterium]